MVYTHEHLNVSSDHPEGLRLAQIWHDIAAIDESIDLSAIRTQEAQGEPYERWGVLWLEELPFFFRAWKVGERNIPILEGNHRRKTTWYAHAPYHPEAFTPPVGSETLSASETEFLLEGLGVAKEVRENAVKEGTLADTHAPAPDEARSRIH